MDPASSSTSGAPRIPSAVEREPLHRGLLPAAIVIALLVLLLRSATASACTAPAVSCPRSETGSPGVVARAAFTQDEWRQLDRGEAVFGPTRTAGGRPARGYTGARILNVAPEQVWAVLTDLESWPSFVPHVEALTVERGARGLLVRQRTRVLWKQFEHTAACRVDVAAGRLEFRLDPSEPGDFRRLEASFEVVSLDEGRRTLLRVRSALETDGQVPDFVKRAIAGKALPESLEAFDAEAQRRAQQAPAGRAQRGGAERSRTG